VQYSKKGACSAAVHSAHGFAHLLRGTDSELIVDRLAVAVATAVSPINGSFLTAGAATCFHEL
jgi:hypothetical protein